MGQISRISSTICASLFAGSETAGVRPYCRDRSRAWDRRFDGGLQRGLSGSTQASPVPRCATAFIRPQRLSQKPVSVGGVSAFDYAEIRRHTAVFASAGIFYWNDLTLTGLEDARHINVVNASATLFDVLGVNPQLGRTFSEAEDQYGAVGTTLLSDGLWRSAFGADPNVLGRVIHLNGAPFTVVGVMPRSFHFPSHETQLWIPVSLSRVSLRSREDDWRSGCIWSCGFLRMRLR